MTLSVLEEGSEWDEGRRLSANCFNTEARLGSGGSKNGFWGPMPKSGVVVKRSGDGGGIVGRVGDSGAGLTLPVGLDGVSGGRERARVG